MTADKIRHPHTRPSGRSGRLVLAPRLRGAPAARDVGDSRRHRRDLRADRRLLPASQARCCCWCSLASRRSPGASRLRSPAAGTWVGLPHIALAVLGGLIAVSTALAPEPVSVVLGHERDDDRRGHVAHLLVGLLPAQPVRAHRRAHEADLVGTGRRRVSGRRGRTAPVAGRRPARHADLRCAGVDAHARELDPGQPRLHRHLPGGSRDRRQPRLRPPRADGWRRWLAAGCTGLMALVAFITLTRAAWLGIAVGLLLLRPARCRPQGVHRTARRYRRRRRGRTARHRHRARDAGLVHPPLHIALAGTRLLLGGAHHDMGRHAADHRQPPAVRHRSRPPAAGRLRGAARHHRRRSRSLRASRPAQRGALRRRDLWRTGASSPWARSCSSSCEQHSRRSARHTTVTRTRTLYSGWIVALGTAVFVSLLSVFPLHAVFFLFVYAGVVVAPTLKPSREDCRGYRRSEPWSAVVFLAVGLYGTSLAWASSRQLMLARYAETQIPPRGSKAIDPLGHQDQNRLRRPQGCRVQEPP